MHKLILTIACIFALGSPVWADDLGCFEPDEAVQLRLSVLSLNTISGVTSDLRYPDDTQVSTPTMTQINGNSYKTSYTVATSPSQEGKYFLYYYYTDGSTVYSSSNRGPYDSFTVRTAGQCGTRGTQVVTAGTVSDKTGYSLAATATGTENGASTFQDIYWDNAINQRTYLGMCMEVTVGSNTERSRIIGYGAGYNTVRGFSTTPTDATTVNIYEGGCN